jgi:hypothetical protein
MKPARAREIVMKARLALIGMIAGLLLLLAAVDAGAVTNSGLNQAGAGANLERSTAPTAKNFGRTEDEGKQGDKLALRGMHTTITCSSPARPG